MAPTCWRERVPILSTSASAIATISLTSSGASAMTGAAPIQSVTLAQSLMVTALVIWWMSGRPVRIFESSAAKVVGVIDGFVLGILCSIHSLS